MRVNLEDVCDKASSNLKQSDVEGKAGDYPIYGAAGYIGNVDFYHQEKPYVAVVKDGAGIGRTALMPGKSSVIGTMQYLLPKENVLPEYLYYVVRYMHLEKYFSGATIPHIYFRDYKNEEFQLDDLGKQARIIEVLGRVEKIIELREQELAALDNMIKARFVEMFGDVADYINITEIAHTYIGLVTTMTTHYCDVGTPLLFNSSIKADKIVWEGTYLEPAFAEANKSRMHKTYDILTVHTGDIGTSAVIDEEFNNSLGFATIVTRINDRKKYNPRYISSFLNYGSGKEQLTKYSRDVRNNLNLKDFNRLMVPKASFSAQNEYANFVKQVDKSKVAVQKALDESQILFDSLMQEYFG